MAGSLNKVMLIGNLGNDPDIRTMQNGGKVANLSIATSETWKDKNTGERKEKTEWHRVSVFNDGLVGICEQYLKKGSKVFIEGQLETRKWQDQNGQDKYSTEIVLKAFNGSLTMLDSREGNSTPQQQSSQGQSYAQKDSVPAGGGDPFEDNIPFNRINDKLIGF